MKALVTGGGGFLGSAVLRALVERGDEVVSLARGDYPALRELGVRALRGDVADEGTVTAAAEGCDVVLHVAAKAGDWGKAADYERSNIDGTRAVVAACRAAGVPRLVYTSTPSVVHDGGDIEGGDESLPYATSFSSHYPRTKAVAERMVLAADGPELATTALRPHLVWGPADPHFLPQILDRARRGRLFFIDGGSALIDTTYIDDAAAAHLLAADRLAPGAACAGRAYFITSGDPRSLRDVINGILVAAGEQPVDRSVPLPVALAAGAGVELAWRLLRRDDQPLMTRFLARQLASAHWFDISAARRDLGYEPPVGLDEGFERLARWCAAQVPAEPGRGS